jgi:hypothetical protein
MAAFIWGLYTRRIHFHSELVDMRDALTQACMDAKEHASLEYTRMKEYLESRVKELASENREYRNMLIGAQQTAAKSMDLLSEKKKDI